MIRQRSFLLRLTLLQGQVERNQERASYRRTRRGRLRYRKPRFNNRKIEKVGLRRLFNIS